MKMTKKVKWFLLKKTKSFKRIHKIQTQMGAETKKAVCKCTPLILFFAYSCSQLCQMFCTSSSSSMMSMSFSIRVICSSVSSF